MATPIPLNQARFSLDEIVRATGGRLTKPDPGQTVVIGVSTDSRTLVGGEVFVALRGERFDGHDSIEYAVERGASAVVVERGWGTSRVPTMEVEDTLVALGRLAHANGARLRKALCIPVVAVSGAVGKTSTKELVAAALRAAFHHGETLATPGNLNNLVGAPLTLLLLDERHRSAVIECGSNAPGEIARIAEIVDPDVAVCTNADAAHTEHLGSVEAVAEEEGSLFAHALRSVVANADEPLSFAQARRRRPGVILWTFGSHPDAHVRVVARRTLSDGRSEVILGLDPDRFEGVSSLVVTTELLGPSAAQNIAAAVAAVRAASAPVETLPEVARALGAVAPIHGRLCLEERGGVVLLDDTYNASPRALVAALEAARELCEARGGRLVVALGDMLELGGLSAEAHRTAGRRVIEARAAVFVATGSAMLEAARVAWDATSDTEVIAVPDSTEAGAELEKRVRPGDVVLAKGSRGTRMERALDALRARWPSEAPR